MNIGEPKIPAGVPEREFFMIEAKEMQNRSMQVVHMDLIFRGSKAELVGCAVHKAALHTAAGHPHGKAVVVMVPSVDLTGIRTRRRQFYGWSAAKLTPPNYQGVFQHTALLQIFEQRAYRLIALSGELAVVDFDIVMIVPRLTRTVPNLDEADPTLH
jgi:hypothetical protein